MRYLWRIAVISPTRKYLGAHIRYVSILVTIESFGITWSHWQLSFALPEKNSAKSVQGCRNYTQLVRFVYICLITCDFSEPRLVAGYYWDVHFNSVLTACTFLLSRKTEVYIGKSHWLSICFYSISVT